MSKDNIIKNETRDKNIIYLSIDHLKRGRYNLRITLKNKVIKSLFFKKEGSKDAINWEKKGGN